MSKRKYPYVSSITTRIRMPKKKWPKATCFLCDHVTPKGQTVQIVTIQVNWFRGDDEIEVLCLNCKPNLNKFQKKWNEMMKDK